MASVSVATFGSMVGMTNSYCDGDTTVVPVTE